MGYKIVIDPVAIQDITECIEWYNNILPGLGVKFYKHVQSVFKIILRNPHAFPIRYKTSHTAMVRKFPFMVHYFVDVEKNTIVITSVLHTSRNPEIWNARPENKK
jgi:hypothetical protein